MTRRPPDPPAPVLPGARHWILVLRVRWSRGRLDRELAAGTAPESSPELQLRAGQLIAPRSRRALATVIAHLLDAAEEPPGVLEREAPARALNRAAVRRARSELLAVAALLSGDGPVSIRTAARAQVLACDERGPLYGAAARDTADGCPEGLRRARVMR